MQGLSIPFAAASPNLADAGLLDPTLHYFARGGPIMYPLLIVSAHRADRGVGADLLVEPRSVRTAKADFVEPKPQPKSEPKRERPKATPAKAKRAPGST